MSGANDFQPDEARRSDGRIIVHHHINWGTVKADIVKRTGLSRQETRLAPRNHVLLFNLKGEARSGEDFIQGRKVAFIPRRAGSIVFLPPDSEWQGWDEGDATGAYLLVSVDPSYIEQAFGTAYVSSLKPVIGLRDHSIAAPLQGICAEVVNPDPISTMMVESRIIQVFVQLLRRNCLQLEPAKGGLSTIGLRRVVAILQDKLADPPGLDELALEVGLSRRHFIRAFKQSTGKTPHSYLAKQRLERATDLLRTTNLSITDIAFESGFTSSSYFTTAFRRSFSVGPLEYRRLWRT